MYLLENRYPLDIQSVGDDEYIVMSKGHHNPDEFMEAVRDQYNWPLSYPEHRYVKVIPDNSGNKSYLYVFVDESTKGCFPATYAWEAYGDLSYECRKGALK